ncbi:hypothetical protein EYF80_061113 [Liparis tanakae]|uniref:Uncharacterized protein n=1 Tax=Liparis tanakae TaxID=230148 RepID=A0A4Z2EIV5_9TELE|nr:hypothetical protein EYF80_061113 [Liparis tanakae]
MEFDMPPRLEKTGVLETNNKRPEGPDVSRPAPLRLIIMMENIRGNPDGPMKTNSSVEEEADEEEEEEEEEEEVVGVVEAGPGEEGLAPGSPHGLAIPRWPPRPRRPPWFGSGGQRRESVQRESAGHRVDPHDRYGARVTGTGPA